MRAAQRVEGLTLLEVLIVIAIVGVLMGLSANLLMNQVRAANVKESAAAIVRELRVAKSKAQLNSTDTVMIWKDGKYGFGNTAEEASANLKSLTNSVKLTCKTNCGSGQVTFTAPFGELAAVGTVLEVSSPWPHIKPQEIRLVGVTGKAMIVQEGE